MRTKLALLGLAAGAAAFVAPVAPASAYCQEPVIVIDIEGGGSGGCTNGCVETGNTYEAARHSLPGGDKIPGYWDLFVCPM
ncbi:MAG TPA: hypothetical protein VF519_12590 [Mycobacteriales bacterium]|jgi:hypothetical protein